MERATMKSANPPTKHHYIPAFYLKRWAGADGRVTEFTKPYRDIVFRPIKPDRTGYQERLYEMKGYEPELAQQIEEKFFKLIDTQASGALDLLESYGDNAPWTSDSRSSWTRFMISLLLRCPEDISLFRKAWHADFVQTDEESELKYRSARTNDDPETFADFMDAQPLSVKERSQFEALLKLIDHAEVGREINGMHWRVLQTPEAAPALLTSDRPIIRTKSISGPQPHMGLPIGPRLLFIASPDAEFLRQLIRIDQITLAKEVNRQVVEGAARFVYGVDDRQLRFVKNRFGRTPQPRLMESIVGERDPAEISE